MFSIMEKVEFEEQIPLTSIQQDESEGSGTKVEQPVEETEYAWFFLSPKNPIRKKLIRLIRWR